MSAWLAPVVLLSLAQQAPTPSGHVRILVLDIKSESVPGETARALRDEVVIELARAPSLSVLSTEDLRAAVSVEAETRAIGCDTTSCLAEIGAAMGARYIVHGSVAKVGGAYAVYLNIFDTDRNEAVAREVADAATEAGLLPAVRGGAAKVRERIALRAPAIGTGGGDLTAASPPEEPIDPLFVGGAVGAGAGALVAVIGGIFVIDSYLTVIDFEKNEPPAREAAQRVGLTASIVTGIGLAVVGAGVGVAAWRSTE